MQKIIALCDYQGRFGSKYWDSPYRSGMDKAILRDQFAMQGWDLVFKSMNNALETDDPIGTPIIYTSQEDFDFKYKSFIEDVICAMDMKHHKLLPPYKFLRANNNKVFMEILRKELLPEKYHMGSKIFGSLEELQDCIDTIHYPCIIKTAEGAGSSGVYRAFNRQELLQKAMMVSRTRHIIHETIDIGRSVKHKGYQRESRYRNKFIIQDFIPHLDNDWKILVFYDKYFVLRRNNRHGDFRASGSGLFSFDDTVNTRLLEAAAEIICICKLPMISLDLAFTNDTVFLIEMQFVYFGTSTLVKSPYYYQNTPTGWNQVFGKVTLESEFVYGIANFLQNSPI